MKNTKFWTIMLISASFLVICGSILLFVAIYFAIKTYHGQKQNIANIRQFLQNIFRSIFTELDQNRLNYQVPRQRSIPPPTQRQASIVPPTPQRRQLSLPPPSPIRRSLSRASSVFEAIPETPQRRSPSNLDTSGSDSGESNHSTDNSYQPSNRSFSTTCRSPINLRPRK